MMKMLSVLLVAVLLPLVADARCTYGCYCVNDDACDYYCENNMCQSQTSLWAKCSSYYIHPRQCGTVSYCDPNSNNTCQLKKNYGQRCTYSYTCLSDYCNPRTSVCETSSLSLGWIIPAVFTSTFVFIVLLVVIIAVVNRQRRLRSLAFYQSPYLVLPSATPYSYQNSYIVGEAPPPAYPGALQTPKPYQG
jgi:hypothetical protein